MIDSFHYKISYYLNASRVTDTNTTIRFVLSPGGGFFSWHGEQALGTCRSFFLPKVCNWLAVFSLVKQKHRGLSKARN